MVNNMQNKTQNLQNPKNLTGWNDEARAIAKQILDVIKSSKRILLHCHPSPDPDSLGSTLAMKIVLENMGKIVTAIAGDSVVPQAFSHMPGFETIVQKNINEINLAQFDVFIAQDSGAVDMISKLVPVVFPPSLKVIVIDHHATNTHYGQINLVIPNIPANCALLVALFREWNIAFNQDLARCLYFGIYSDTGGFKYAGISSFVFEAVAFLAGVTPETSKCFVSDISKMENSNTKEAIYLSGLGLSKSAISIDEIKGVTLAISLISNVDIQKAGIVRPEDMSSHAIVGVLRSVEEFEIVVCVIEKEPGNYKMSLRIKSDKFDAGAIAKSLGGSGGGHRGAAGASLLVEASTSPDEIRKKIINTVESYLCSME